MARQVAARCAFMFVLLGACVCHSVLAQTTVRTIPHRDQSIEQRLLPSDEIVEMDYWDAVQFVTYPNESRTQTIARMTQESEVIAVVRVTNVEAMLVEDGSWIRTTIAGIPEEFLKNAGLEQKRFETFVNGGEMRIKGVTVKAGRYPQLRTGGRYLIFATMLEDAPWLLHIYSLDDAAATRRPTWARSTQSDLPANPFEQHSAQSVLAEVRKAINIR